MKVMLIDTPEDPVRLAFGFLFTKREGMANDDGTKGKDTFQANFIIKPDGANAARVKEAITKVAKEKYGTDTVDLRDEDGNVTGQAQAWEAVFATFQDNQKGLRKGGLKRKAEGGEVYDGFAGNVYIAPTNTTRPGVFNRKAVPVAESDEGAPYNGCYVNAEVDIWALNKPKVTKRICSDLLGVQFSRDGDAFGSGAAPSKADSFASLSVADDEDKPKADPFG
jgi:hypothetical protein